ncbi:hypothetical protein AGMMS49975_02480 [Clostridia bacterium]|nr:hypothetical protein AGMMS49975_02480 [Clostridia bacterium]
MIDKAKNLIIAFLVILSVSQIGQLWFDSYDINFFHTAKSLARNGNEKVFLTVPSRIISKDREGSYRIRYNSLDTNLGKYNCNLILDELFLSGEYTGKYAASPSSLAACVIYDYALPMDAADFTESYEQNSSEFKKKSSRLSKNVDSFRQIIFVPKVYSEAKPDSIEINVLFVSNSYKTIYEYTVKIKTTINDNLQLYIADNTVSDLVFTAKSMELFLPVISDAGFPYHPIHTENPYMSADRVLTLKSAQKGLNPLFGDAKITQVSPEDSSYRYSNEANVVVKYYRATDVIEYLDYSTVNKITPSTLPLNYAAAIRFLNADATIANDYYLDSCEISDDSYTFYFDYAVMDFPVLIPDSMKKELNLSHMIELTVSNQKVTKYKKIALTFTPDDEIFNNATIQYEDFMNVWGGENPDDVRLAYKYDKEKIKWLVLNWFLLQNGNSYIRPAS